MRQELSQMIVVPAGEFMMGSPATEMSRDKMKIRNTRSHLPVLRGIKFEVTFEQWDACVAVGGCIATSDSGLDGASSRSSTSVGTMPSSMSPGSPR
jgi:formylglycine-generating enzyme required for sulfatase activity